MLAAADAVPQLVSTVGRLVGFLSGDLCRFSTAKWGRSVYHPMVLKSSLARWPTRRVVTASAFVFCFTAATETAWLLFTTSRLPTFCSLHKTLAQLLQAEQGQQTAIVVGVHVQIEKSWEILVGSRSSSTAAAAATTGEAAEPRAQAKTHHLLLLPLGNWQSPKPSSLSIPLPR